MPDVTVPAPLLASQTEADWREVWPAPLLAAIQQIAQVAKPQRIRNTATIGEVLRRAKASAGYYYRDRFPAIGSYIIRGEGVTWYVGATGRWIPARIAEHLRDRTTLGRVIQGFGTRAMEWEVEMRQCDSRGEAFALESELIDSLDPVLNVCR